MLILHILGNFVWAVATILNTVLTAYMWIVIARAILSWVNPDPYNPIVRFLYSVTEPVMNAIRRRIPASFGGMDFSPMLVILIIYLLKLFVVASLGDLAVSLRS